MIEVDPGTGALIWSYCGDPTRPLDSPIRGSQQRLPNGNTLITESSGGRLLEVTAEGEVVWEYINPVRDEANGKELIPILSWAQRIDVDQLSTEFRDRIQETTRQREEGQRQ